MRSSVAIPYLLLAAWLSVPTSVSAQNTAVGVDCIASAYTTGDMPASFSFGVPLADEEHRGGAIVLRVLHSTGLSRRVAVYAANIENACATRDHNRQPVIYFGEDWLERYSGGNYWIKVGVLAHEVGHHVNGHGDDDGLSAWEREYEADEFVGNVIYRLGGSLEDALLGVSKQPYDGTRSHPARPAREAAVRSGYALAVQQGPPSYEPPAMVTTPGVASTEPEPGNGENVLQETTNAMLSLSLGASAVAGLAEYQGSALWGLFGIDRENVEAVSTFPVVGVTMVAKFRRSYEHPGINEINLDFGFQDSHLVEVVEVTAMEIGNPFQIISPRPVIQQIDLNLFTVLTGYPVDYGNLRFHVKFDTGQVATIDLYKNVVVVAAITRATEN